MGKRDTKASKAKRAERRGQGAVKTEQKIAKAQTKQARRDANRKDDEDLGAIIKEFERMDAAGGKVEESVVPAPSPRVNGSLTAHPSREELIYFGGEVFDGKTTRFFNELYRCTSCPPLPPPSPPPTPTPSPPPPPPPPLRTARHPMSCSLGTTSASPARARLGTHHHGSAPRIPSRQVLDQAGGVAQGPSTKVAAAALVTPGMRPSQQHAPSLLCWPHVVVMAPP